MKSHLLILLIAFGLIHNSCTDSRSQTVEYKISASEFSERIKLKPSAPVIDVRTPEEFAKGHIQNAKNIDWNGNSFEEKIGKLDKSKPIFVYCLSGGRSNAAANKMRADGFKEVYELNGGILKWRASNLPESRENENAALGMTKKQFDELLNTNKLVLVDFNADWCAPCKKMKPYLDEIANDMKDKVIVLSINVDNNQSLCKELNIDALPVLRIYRNKTLTWSNTGFIDKDNVENQLK